MEEHSLRLTILSRLILKLLRSCLLYTSGLAFSLLADPERKVIEAYDVWKEKKNYGKVSMGVVLSLIHILCIRDRV